MSIAEKLTTIAENVNKVYEAGKAAGGGNIEDSPLYYMSSQGYEWHEVAFPEGFDFVLNLKNKPYTMNAMLHGATGLNTVTLICDAEGTTSYMQLVREATTKTLDLTNFKPKPNDISYMCLDTRNLVSIIGALDLSSCTQATFSFLNAFALENIEFVPLTIPLPLDFSSCPHLTHDSLMSIINGLKDFRTLGKYDLTNKANDISSQFFYEDYSDSFVIRSEDVNDYGEDWLHITAPNGGLLRFYKSAFDESIITLLKKEGTKIELDASYTGDGANYFPCIINKLIVTDLADLPEEAHEITPLPDYNEGPHLAETVTEEIVEVEETDTAFIVSGESLKSLSFSKDKFSDDVIKLLKVGNTISWTSYFPEQSIESIAISNCTIYTKTGLQTLTLGTTNLNKLTDTEKAIATEKGWTLV